MTSWVFLLVGLAAIAAGTWIVSNPDKAAEVVGSAQHRSGRGPWSASEQQFDGRNELELPTRPGGRRRAMRIVGVGAVVVGLAVVVVALAQAS